MPRKTKKKFKVVVNLADINFQGARAISEGTVNKANVEMSGADLVRICRARVLARALKDLSQAFTQMDGVFFNPSTELGVRSEVTEKIVELLQSMDLGSCHP